LRRSSETSFSELTRPLSHFLVALLEQVELPVEHDFALLDPLFLALDLLAPAPRLDLPGLAQLDQLFLPGHHRALAQRIRRLLGLTNDPLGGLLGGGLGLGLQRPLGALTRLLSEIEKSRGGEYH
jgi:hypothetical protein